jgi:hypothetical protein
MMESITYLMSTIVLLIVWFIFFFIRKDTRKEMIVMSFLIGFTSVITAHYWWTVDWWNPITLTGTKVGIEDFLMGFGSGGIMAVAYEILFKKRLYKTRMENVRYPDQNTILLILAFFTAWLFWGVGLTSFWASTIAMIIAAGTMFYFRRDLFLNGLLSGVLMMLISLFFYFTIILFSDEWIDKVYYFETLSNIRIFSVPIEEFIFWFLAGLVFGPFYEYWQGKRLRKIPCKFQKV